MKIVQCINIREDFPNQIKEGERYYIDILSIHGDFEGDWYGNIYDINLNFIGTLKLCHFKSI